MEDDLRRNPRLRALEDPLAFEVPTVAHYDELVCTNGSLRFLVEPSLQNVPAWFSGQRVYSAALRIRSITF